MTGPQKPAVVAPREMDFDWFAVGGLLAIAGACHLFFDIKSGEIGLGAIPWAAAVGVGAAALLSERMRRLFQFAWRAAIGLIAVLTLLFLVFVVYLLFFWEAPPKQPPTDGKQPVQSSPRR